MQETEFVLCCFCNLPTKLEAIDVEAIHPIEARFAHGECYMEYVKKRSVVYPAQVSASLRVVESIIGHVRQNP
jgi:hypothetical protein